MNQSPVIRSENTSNIRVPRVTCDRDTEQNRAEKVRLNPLKCENRASKRYKA